jgi:hypothetical protein
MARPKARINSEEVEKLAALGATQEEIADFFSCSHSTISRRFAQEIAKGRASMRIKLRRWQFRAAEQGNVAMLIWLGKTVLHQVEVKADEGANVPTHFVIDM